MFGRRPPRYAIGSPARVPREKNALVASGMRVSGPEGDQLRRLIQPWQSRSFAYYDLLGEIKYAAQFYARMLAPLELYAAEMVTNLDGKTELRPTDNPAARAALDRIQDPGGGRSGLLASYGRLMFLAGESYLLVTRDPDTDMERWEMLSTDELRVQGNTLLRYSAPSLNATEYREPSDEDFSPVDKDSAIAYRLWRRHPRYSMLADATMQGVLDLCEELVLLTHAVRARARSRLAGSGILFLSEDFSSGPLEPVGDEDPAEDPFLADLTEAMTLPMVDEGAASAVVPLVVRGSTDAIEKGVRHLQIIDPTQVYPETGLRYECIKRIALGLDMPPEILLGLEQANHWTAWQIDEQTWKGHGQPVAQSLCDDLNGSYYRPQLKADGVPEWWRYCIAYDAAAIINHPDRTKDAKDLYGARAIGKRALREAAGFDEDDAPTEDELAEMIGVAVRDGGLALYGEPTLRQGAAPEAPPDDAANLPPEGASAETDKGPPAPPDEPPAETVIGSGNGNGHGESVARILGAADLALLRCREAAGNRLRSLAKRDPACLRLVEGVRAGEVAFVLGPERVKALGAPPSSELVSGAHGLVVDALRVFGIDDGAVGDRIVENIERHAASTLYDERPTQLPTSFTNYIAGLTSRPLTPA